MFIGTIGTIGRVAAAGASASTLNPNDTATNWALSNGNLTATKTASAAGGTRGSLFRNSGKLYFEITLGSQATSMAIGVSTTAYDPKSTGSPASNSGATVYNTSNGSYNIKGTFSSGSGGAVAGDTIGFEFDLDASSVSLYKNNSSIRVVAIPAGLIAPTVYGAVSGDIATLNTGGSQFFRTPTDGFLPWG